MGLKRGLVSGRHERRTMHMTSTILDDACARRMSEAAEFVSRVRRADALAHGPTDGLGPLTALACASGWRKSNYRLADIVALGPCSV